MGGATNRIVSVFLHPCGRRGEAALIERPSKQLLQSGGKLVAVYYQPRRCDFPMFEETMYRPRARTKDNKSRETFVNIYIYQINLRETEKEKAWSYTQCLRLAMIINIFGAGTEQRGQPRYAVRSKDHSLRAT